MGGKVWSEKEEQIFWSEIVPRSVGAAKAVAPALGWLECAGLMQETMGKDARRTYTPSMLYEHHYQCINLSTKSPKAKPFVDKWKQDRDNIAGAAPCSSAPAEPSKEKEDYLSLILAHDPGAKRYLRKKGAGRGRDGMEKDHRRGPAPRVEDGRIESTRSAEQFVNPSQAASLAHPYGLDLPGPRSFPSMGPSTQYGYGKVGPEPSIDPALSGRGIAIDRSGSSPDDIPELSTSISSSSSFEDSFPDNPTTRHYRPIAPAPLPPIDTLQRPMYTSPMYLGSSFVTANSTPQHVGYNSEQRPGKRQSTFDYEDESRPKRRSLDTDGQHQRALDPRPPTLTHWQRMGFRDEGGRARVEARGDHNRLPPISFGDGNQNWPSQPMAQGSQYEPPRQNQVDHDANGTDVRHHAAPNGRVGGVEDGPGERDQ